MAIVRKSYSGAAVATTLTSGITNSSTSIPVAATTNFPNTAIGPFVVVIERGTVNEEKVLISSYTSTSLTVQTRGYDGTTAVGHNNGVSLVCCNDATSMQEAHDAAALVGSVTPGTSAVGDVAAAGTSTVVAAADHKHGRESFGGAASTSAPGDSAGSGSASTPARSDHVHGRESYATITSGLTYGTSVSSSAPTDAGTAGVATTPSRSDHVHARRQPGDLLALVQYGPTTDPAYVINANNVMTALDATNLTISFTVPASGQVKLVAAIDLFVSVTGGSGAHAQIALGYLNHTGGAVVGVAVGALKLSNQTSAYIDSSVRGRYSCLVSGLTPGASMQVDLAAAASGGGPAWTVSAHCDNGSNVAGGSGPAILEVFAA